LDSAPARQASRAINIPNRIPMGSCTVGYYIVRED
jgi:hypothetical protein